MATTRLILIRHAQGTVGSSGPEGRMVGRMDVPLSDLGRRQAEALRLRLTREPPVAAVYSSPLQRALETARLAAGPLLGAPRLMKSLSEIDCGSLDGLRIAEVQARHPELWAANLRQDDPDFRWPGGESYRELRERSLEAVHRISRVHPGERVLVVTHTGVISEVLGSIHGIDPACWESYRPGPASVTVVDWEGRRGTLVCFDDRRHLSHLEE